MVFRIGAEAFEQRFASLSLRVLDGPRGAPRNDVRITLKADRAPHRRREQMALRPDVDGRLRFERVVPGSYEISIEAEDALHQERIDLTAAEARDLGNIPLPRRGVVEIRAVDGRDQPAVGWLEIAPYRRGVEAKALYPPNLHRSLDPDGRFRLPMPTETSVVRVTPRDPQTRSQSPHPSLSVLLDPSAPPTTPLELVVLDPVRIVFEGAPLAGTRLQVLDDLGLVVAWPGSRAGRLCEALLVPGGYTVRRIDEDGAALNETSFTLGREALHLRLP
jgi:5-hydroxyisourate hydrolase-like protein (transthyretin family)